MKEERRLKMSSRQTVEKIGFILLGTIVLSFGFYNFYFLNHITEGGVLGFLLILKNLFAEDSAMVRENMDFISKYDPEIGAAVKGEFNRQVRNI